MRRIQIFKMNIEKALRAFRAGRIQVNPIITPFTPGVPGAIRQHGNVGVALQELRADKLPFFLFAEFGGLGEIDFTEYTEAQNPQLWWDQIQTNRWEILVYRGTLTPAGQKFLNSYQ